MPHSLSDRCPRLVAVVVNHNGGQGLLDCLAAQAAYPLRPAVVVVDNASTDGSAAAAQIRFADITLLCNRHNDVDLRCAWLRWAMACTACQRPGPGMWAGPQRFWPLVAATTLFPSPVARPRSG